MTRTQEIAKLLNVSEDIAEKVLEEMENMDLDFSECEQTEFDDCAREAYREITRLENKSAKTCNEFPNIAVPTCLDNDQWKDTSWHNDATASMTEVDETNDLQVMVWINPDDVTQREWLADHKFIVMLQNIQTGDLEDNELPCDTEIELLAAIQIMKARKVASHEQN